MGIYSSGIVMNLIFRFLRICSLCAAVQGLDELLVDGARIFYKMQVSIEDDNESVPAGLAKKSKLYKYILENYIYHIDLELMHAFP